MPKLTRPLFNALALALALHLPACDDDEPAGSDTDTGSTGDTDTSSTGGDTDTSTGGGTGQAGTSGATLGIPTTGGSASTSTTTTTSGGTVDTHPCTTIDGPIDGLCPQPGPGPGDLGSAVDLADAP